MIAASAHQIYAGLLALARTAGLLTTAPVPGTRPLPGPVLYGLSLLLSLALTPMVAAHTGALPGSLLLLAGEAAANLALGLAMGWLAALLFSAVEMAGHLTDLQMGFGIVNLLNPVSQQQSSMLGVFYTQLSLTIYLLLNGHLLLLGALSRSFLLAPPDSLAAPASLGLQALPAAQELFLLALQLAVPALGVLLLTDLALGLMARLVPQLNVFLVGMPAKIVMGLLTVSVVLPAIAAASGSIVAQSAAAAAKILPAAGR